MGRSLSHNREGEPGDDVGAKEVLFMLIAKSHSSGNGPTRSQLAPNKKGTGHSPGQNHQVTVSMKVLITFSK